MKRHFFLYKLGVVPLIILCCSVNAQTGRSTTGVDTYSLKEIALDDNPKELPSFNINSGLSAKALRNFGKSFKEADNAVWFQTSDGVEAEFIKDEIETKVFYDRKGRWIANISAYRENKLPKDIRHRVKNTYYDYDIFHVQEVTVRDKTVYLVKIEGQDFIKTIRILEGEMDEYIVIDKNK